jgi:hypothetical protein
VAAGVQGKVGEKFFFLRMCDKFEKTAAAERGERGRSFGTLQTKVWQQRVRLREIEKEREREKERKKERVSE